MPSSAASRTSPVQAYLSLGSNLGDRAGYLRAALKELAVTPGIELGAVSSIYETEPAYVTDQPRFLNLAAEVNTTLDARQLFRRCKEIEAKLGRVKRERFGPREVDLDLLLYGEEAIEEEGLTVPHPAMIERSFVLVPLAEIAPDLRLADGCTAREHAAPFLSEVTKHGDV